MIFQKFKKKDEEMASKCAVCGSDINGDGVKVIKHCQQISAETVEASGREPGYEVMTCEEAGWSAKQHRWYEQFLKGLGDSLDVEETMTNQNADLGYEGF